MTKLYLFDIEGTTTDIHFVHKVLFPYSFEKMEEFILGHKNMAPVIEAINQVIQTVQEEENRGLNLSEVIEKLMDSKEIFGDAKPRVFEISI
jgi:enolase-phosphatase E1